jgi:hypothetical protein
MMFSTKTSRVVLVLAAACNAVTSAEDAVNLGLAGDYVVLSKSGISTIPDSVITGDIGVSPAAATYFTGFDLMLDSGIQYSTSTQVSGQAHAASYGGVIESTLTVAVLNMQAAYTDAAGRAGVATKTNIVGGYLGPVKGTYIDPLTAGVYTFDRDITIAGDLHFNGSSTDVFIIRTTGNLQQLAGTIVKLVDGAKAENIFWQIAGHVVVEGSAHMKGIILAKNYVRFETSSSLQGRILTQTACVLQQATVKTTSFE